jgi:hypothetical protein
MFLHGNQLLKAFSQKQISHLQKLHENNGSFSQPYEAYLYMKSMEEWMKPNPKLRKQILQF